MREHLAAVPTSLRSSCLPAVCLVLASRGARTSNSCRTCEGKGREPVLVAEPLPRHRALSTARRVYRYEQLVTLVARATRGAATPDQWQISPARTRPRQTARSGLIRFGRCTGRTLAPPRRKDCNHRVSDGKQRSAHAQGRCGLSLPLPWTPALEGLAALCACCLVVRRSLFSPWFCSVNLFVV